MTHPRRQMSVDHAARLLIWANRKWPQSVRRNHWKWVSGLVRARIGWSAWDEAILIYNRSLTRDQGRGSGHEWFKPDWMTGECCRICSVRRGSADGEAPCAGPVEFTLSEAN